MDYLVPYETLRRCLVQYRPLWMSWQQSRRGSLVSLIGIMRDNGVLPGRSGSASVNLANTRFDPISVEQSTKDLTRAIYDPFLSSPDRARRGVNSGGVDSNQPKI